MTNTKFYTFNQNNSGGFFKTSDTEGIGEYVIIEAIDSNHANDIAESIGIYFDGCRDGSDCSCCGDRWYPTSNYDESNEPSIYSTPVKEHIGYWNAVAFIHYLDKRIEKIIIPDKTTKELIDEKTTRNISDNSDKPKSS